MGDEEISKQAEKFAKESRTRLARKLTDTSIYTPVDIPISVFMAGSPGAGKTEFSKNLIKQFEENKEQVIRIDSDDIREEMPGYTGNNSYLFQGPVSLVVERVHDYALKRKQNFILDGTFSKYDKAVKNIKRSLEKKRVVVIFYVYQKPEIAWKFTEAREKEEGRKIPKTAFIDQFLGAYDTINQVCKDFKDAKILIFLVKKDFSQDTRETIIIHKNKGLDHYLPNRYTRDEVNKLL